ncbi:inactive CLIP domain-containing serine protease A8-like [Cydia fagiglandana]|uniref:inactive CLIP domain-containing serine protease A8-like n=1 Tax=Cydia fagiglandana TaxID=1458189 RepID=UPI002FEE246D
MCLWLLTACLGMLPANSPPTNVIVVGAPPAPILVPTTTTTASPNMTGPPPPMNMTGGPPMTMTGGGGGGAPPTMAPTAPTGPIGGVLLPVILCDTPDIVCIINLDETAAGMPSIDPRFGTTPAPSAALQVPPIIGYSAQVPSYNTAVRFPRERRSIQLNTIPTNKLDKSGMMETASHRIRKRQAGCRCVAAGTCTNNGTNAGGGLIDIRIVTPGGGSGPTCPAGQVLCCGSSTTVIACGTLQTVPATAIAPASGQANFGEYPWQALILTKQNDYIAGGVLIDQFNVLTVTHRLSTYVVSGAAPNVKVRLGDWDAAGTYEPVPYQEYTVAKVSSHPSFNPTTLQYDITVLRLSTPVPLTPMPGSVATINRACLPASNAATYTGQRCWVSGWGKNMFGLQGQYQQILKKVDVPIVDPATCQSQMQAARLGPGFALDTTSFICAGGEANKDSCTGDGGSGLVCQVNGQWVVVGLVAWGLGCANANVPAAYVNVAALLPWIQAQVATA